MHETLPILAGLAIQARLPSLTAMLLSLSVFGFLVFAGTRSVSRSRSISRPADRVLTNTVDDKGVPLFFVLDTHDSDEPTPAWEQVSRRSRIRQR